MSIWHHSMKGATVYALLALEMTSSTLIPARAEGSRNFNAAGVNRRVYTPAGYDGVAGTVTNIRFRMPARNGNLTANANVNGRVVLGTNPYDNKPTVYLGGRGDAFNIAGAEVEVDAGLQFETGIYRQVDPGWSAFSSRIIVQPGNEAQYTSPRYWDGTAWQPWRSSPNTWGPETPTSYVGSLGSYLRFDFTANGEASLVVGELNRMAGITQAGQWQPFLWNQNAAGLRPTPADVAAGYRVWPYVGMGTQVVQHNANLRVKRVVGMTRARAGSPNLRGAIGATTELDGSTLQCAFEGGQVSPANSSQWSNWAIAHNNGPAVNQAETGYDAPETGHPAYDRRWRHTRTPTSLPIVRFPGYNDPAARSGPGNGVANDRYSAETVQINLRSASGPGG